MTKPILRVTRWLGTIPVEATCNLCPGTTFRAQSSSHRPDLATFQRSLQSQFERHCREAHADHSPTPSQT